MPDAEGKMVRRAFRDPALEKRPHVGTEKAASVGVAGRGDWAVHTFTLGDDELEFALRRDADAEHRDRAFLDLELNARAATGLTVVLDQAAQHGLSVGDVEVMRAVVADQYKTFAEIDRVKLGEAAANTEAIHDQHRDARFQIGLAA